MDARLEVQRGQYVTIIDASRAAPTPATQRRKQADWLDRQAPLLAKRSLGTAFIITSPMVRGIYTAVLWLRPMPTEHVVCSTCAEAEAWAAERLAAAGIDHVRQPR
jgi:hypothetical protein